MSFVRDETISRRGTSCVGYFSASYSALAAALGPAVDCGDEGDGRVSTRWTFRSAGGSPVALYEYKETALYGDSDLTVEQFRALPEYEWHVGTFNRGIAQQFTEWLRAQLASAGAPPGAQQP